MVECNFHFGRNNDYQPSAIETDTEATTKSIVWIWVRLRLFLFVLAPFGRIVERELNLAIGTCTFLPLASRKKINSDTKSVEDVFYSEIFPCPHRLTPL